MKLKPSVLPKYSPLLPYMHMRGCYFSVVCEHCATVIDSFFFSPE